MSAEEGAERVAYLKRYDDGVMVYVAEASRKRKIFAPFLCGSIRQRLMSGMCLSILPAPAYTSETGWRRTTILPPIPEAIKMYCTSLPNRRANGFPRISIF